MTSLQIHNCQFVDCIPDAITSIVPSPSQKYIAVGRANGDIQIWSVEKWYLRVVCSNGGGSDFRKLKLIIIDNTWAQTTCISSFSLDTN